MNLRTRRSSALIALALAAALPLAACGGDGDSSSDTTERKSTTTKKATTTEAGGDGVAKVRAALEESNDLGLSSEELDCAAKRLDEELGTDAAVKVVQPDEPVDDRYLDQTAAVFEECVPAASYAAGITHVIGGEGVVSDQFTTCLAGEFEGKVGQSFKEGNREGTPQTMVTAFEKCASPQDTTALFTSVFAESGMDKATAECVTSKLAPTFGIADLMGQTEELQAAVGDAMSACGASDAPSTTAG